MFGNFVKYDKINIYRKKGGILIIVFILKLLLIGILFYIFTYYPVSMYFYIVIGSILILEIISYLILDKEGNRKKIEEGVVEVAKGNLSKNLILRIKYMAK